MEPQPANCQAILWNTGRNCTRASTPASPYCSSHAELLMPLDWQSPGYPAVLDVATQPLFHQARFLNLADELAVARLHLSRLLHDNGPSRHILDCLRAIAALARLQRQIERSLARSARGRTGKKP